MAITLPPVPIPPPPSVSRYDAAGKPTVAQVQYEQKLRDYLQAVKTAVEGM